MVAFVFGLTRRKLLQGTELVSLIPCSRNIGQDYQPGLSLDSVFPGFLFSGWRLVQDRLV
jgi:hypothetical protein